MVRTRAQGRCVVMRVRHASGLYSCVLVLAALVASAKLFARRRSTRRGCGPRLASRGDDARRRGRAQGSFRLHPGAGGGAPRAPGGDVREPERSGERRPRVRRLPARFLSVCGPCHPDRASTRPGKGAFRIQTAGAFSTDMTSTRSRARAHRRLSGRAPNPTNPADPMPPCSSPNGMTYSQRPPNDPVLQLAQLIQEWLKAGSPAQFAPPPTADQAAATAGDAGADGGASSSRARHARRGRRG